VRVLQGVMLCCREVVGVLERAVSSWGHVRRQRQHRWLLVRVQERLQGEEVYRCVERLWIWVRNLFSPSILALPQYNNSLEAVTYWRGPSERMFSLVIKVLPRSRLTCVFAKDNL